MKLPHIKEDLTQQGDNEKTNRSRGYREESNN